ncbi:MAG: ATP-binding cassette domain-containing protein [archaeon]
MNKEKIIISIKDLNKTFKTKVSEPGIKSGFKNIFNPQYKIIKAVNNISFDVREGELVSFIGPNGAGKSTTLKMLSGILHPDSGTIKVNNLSPQKEPQKLSYKIGTIFGQKPQLWFHLPPIDSFNLFSKIYDLDQKEFKKRLEYLINSFEINEYINQPVRKLSLGQRMRCEFVLALLHNPKILFLDEPTIGMDIIVKKTIRELIKKINDEEKVTVILTSHDMGDIESIANRVIVINHGAIVYDDSFENLKKNYIKKKIIRIVTENEIKNINTKEMKIIEKTKYSLEFEINTKKLSIHAVIDYLMKENKVKDISIKEPPIEEIIEEIYKKEEIQ